MNYWLVSAVRGPDNEDNHILTDLKSHVTTRIRALVMPSRECPGMWVAGPLGEWGFNIVMKAIAALKPADRHFIYHLYKAVQVSVDNPVWGGYGAQLAQTLEEAVYRLQRGKEYKWN